MANKNNLKQALLEEEVLDKILHSLPQMDFSEIKAVHRPLVQEVLLQVDFLVNLRLIKEFQAHLVSLVEIKLQGLAKQLAGLDRTAIVRHMGVAHIHQILDT